MWPTQLSFAPLPSAPGGVAGRFSKQTLASIAAVVLLVAAGIIVYFNHRPTAVRGGTDWNARLQCAECGHQFDALVELKYPVQPQHCPNCGKNAAWEMKYCSACKTIFLPPITGDPPRPQAMPPCPKCKDNKNVGAYIPGLDMDKLGLEQKGD